MGKRPQGYSVKGWNFGETKFEDEKMKFEVDNKPNFEVPLTSVVRCDVTDHEVMLEFNTDNDDGPVELAEMRFHIPRDPDHTGDSNRVEEFRSAVMKYAEVENDSEQLCLLPQVPCVTPRGRYDLKLFQTHFSFHGKTYDFKVPFKAVVRTFMLPHNDNREIFFVFHVNPPVRQSQTRYPFVVMLFDKNEHIEIALEMSQKELTEKYEDKLQVEMNGPFAETLARFVSALTKARIVVPGRFLSSVKSPAVSCSLRQASGYLYPLEKGFIFVHKPTHYITYPEVSEVHFARSELNTRSFDFEVNLKAGQNYIFGSVQKQEFDPLYRFCEMKGLKIRNAHRVSSRPVYAEDVLADSDSDDEDYDVEKEKDKGSSSESDESSEEASGENDDDE
ncbi:histone chaperone like domain-containing protein [Ditylenchus destructor]|nr:histone chaperone like domain-containing protein [Ditylenchus destructor]